MADQPATTGRVTACPSPFSPIMGGAESLHPSIVCADDDFSWCIDSYKGYILLKNVSGPFLLVQA